MQLNPHKKERILLIQAGIAATIFFRWGIVALIAEGEGTLA